MISRSLGKSLASILVLTVIITTVFSNNAFAVPLPGTLYGITGADSPSDFFELLPGTGTENFIGSTGKVLSGIEFDSDGTLYAAGSAAGGWASFGTIDPASGIFILISPSLECTDIAIDPTNGILYCQSKNTLYSADKITGVATLVGSTGITQSSGSAMGIASDGTMYYGNQIGLYSVDKTTGTTTLINNWTLPPEITDIDCRPNAFDFDPSGILWASLNCFNNYLVTIDTATAQMTFVDNTISGLDGISFAPAVNTPPVLDAVAPITIDEGSTVSFTAHATDFDVPAQTLTYSITGAPFEATIDLSTGVFDWITTETDGPGIYTFQVHVTDSFFDVFTEVSITVNEVPDSNDTVPPEAYNQFDPVTKDIKVFGTDDTDGDLGSITPIVTYHGKKEVRTYTIQDAAGNKLVLVEKVKMEGKEIKVDVQSLQYNDDAVITVDAEKKFSWSLNKDDSIKELEQKMIVGKHDKQKVEAEYNLKKNQTKIESKNPKSKETLPGMVLLKMSTNNGSLVISH